MLVICLSSIGALSQQSITDSLQHLYAESKENEQKSHQALLLIEAWMDLEKLDSAQFWANELFSVLPGNKQDVVHYYYNSRQSEIYYYNNFPRLGLQNAERGLQIALSLNDSVFIADAYNFRGLFLMNLNRIQEAISSFKLGLQWSVWKSNPPKYLSLTQYYHLLGNLAEALLKNNEPAASLHYAFYSYNEAVKHNRRRAISVAQNQIGSCYDALGKTDSALHFFKACISGIDNDIDVLLLNYASLGQHFKHLQLNEQANSAFKEGVLLLTKRPDINSYFSIEFLNKAIVFFRETAQEKLLQNCIYKKMMILDKVQADYNVQINEVMEAALKNETQLLNLRIANEARKVKLDQYKIIALSTLLVSVLLIFLLYRNRLLKKLELAKLQNNIQQDLHDELGGSLSIIRILSDLMSSKKLSQEEIASLSQKISGTASEAAQKMNTLIWALNTENDSVANLCEYTRQYSIAFFEGTTIDIHFEEKLSQPNSNIYGTARKNIFLCIKESLHNVLKHANASAVHIRFETTNAQQLIVTVSDNGKGMQQNNQFGNGLKNMQQRMAAIGGTASFTNNAGCTVVFECSLH